MTKKHYITFTFISTIILSVLAWLYLPIVTMGGYRVGNVFMRLFYVGFLALTVSLILTYIIILAKQREYVNKQLITLHHFRHLIKLMVKRDFITRYRRSVLGVLWSVLNPLLTMIIFAAVFSTIFGMETHSFAIYVFSGQLVFNFFSEATNTAMASIVGSAGTIKKLYVPKYIFPMAKVLSSAVNLSFAFIAFIIVFVATQTPFHWTLFLIPIPVLYVFIFSMGVGMILSAMAVFFRDITYIYGVLTTMLFFMTPIMYPVEILTTQVFHVLHLNPLFHFLSYFRDLALNGIIPGLWENIVCLGFALGALAIGAYVKMSQQDKYILYL